MRGIRRQFRFRNASTNVRLVYLFIFTANGIYREQYIVDNFKVALGRYYSDTSNKLEMRRELISLGVAY